VHPSSRRRAVCHLRWSIRLIAFFDVRLSPFSSLFQAAAFKNVVTKKTMGASWAKELGPQNTYAVVTILSLLATLPVVLAVDLPVLPTIIKNLQNAGKLNDLIKFGVYSGTYVWTDALPPPLSAAAPILSMPFTELTGLRADAWVCLAVLAVVVVS
jgi:hypothetical protein